MHGGCRLAQLGCCCVGQSVACHILRVFHSAVRSLKVHPPELCSGCAEQMEGRGALGSCPYYRQACVQHVQVHG
jgi:hypothetical protein